MTPQRSCAPGHPVYMYKSIDIAIVEMPFNLKSRRPPDISNNNASAAAVRGPFNSGQKAIL